MGGFIAPQGHASAGPHLWIQALLQPWSLSMSLSTVTTNGREDRALPLTDWNSRKNWLCHSLAEVLRREMLYLSRAAPETDLFAWARVNWL